MNSIWVTGYGVWGAGRNNATKKENENKESGKIE